ncbi:hypothetical protein Tco_0773943 [Tanacetum coccineum]|uniref:Reverse transcriptase domain-containing protein n=1 Tax=Tanacetum coccineum TaxID=301880 RepID=A0ABQ4ZN58_9ASTR
MKLTHVCFVDDILMSFHGDMNSVNVLKEAIEEFGAYSNVYNARLKPDMVVKDLVANGICIWPSEWVEKYPNLSLIQNVVIDEFKQDEMLWRSHNGRE